MDGSLIKLDGVLWDIRLLDSRQIFPLCPVHRLEMDTFPSKYSNYSAKSLKCEECSNRINLPRTIADEKRYLINKINSLEFKKMKVLNIDDEAIPIASDAISSKDDKFFVKAILTDSRVGKRLIVYAGEKGKKDKTQIFIEPQIRRLAFDQNNLHPGDVFLKLEGIFDDGTSSIMKSKKIK